MPGNLHDAEPGRVVDGEPGPASVYEFKLREGVKFHNGDPFTAEDVKFSFQRSKGRQGAQGQRARGQRRRARPRALPCSTSRSPTSWRSTARSPPARAGSCRGSTSRRSATRASRRHPIGLGPYRVRQLHAGRRAGHGGLRGLLAEDAVGEAAGVQDRARADHAGGDAQARARSTSPTCWTRRRRRPSSAIPAPSSASRGHRHALPRLLRPVGPEIAVGTTSACGWPPTTPSTARRSARPRRSAPRGPRAACPRARSSSRLPLPALRLRPGEGQAAPRRGRLSQRLRRRRPLPVPALLLGGRDDRRLPRRGGDPHADAHDGARGVLCRRGRRRSSTACACARWPTYGNAATRLPTSCRATGPTRYGGDPDVDALYKQQARETDRKKREAQLHQIQQLVYDRVRFGPHLRVHLGQRDRAAGGRARADADRPVPLVGAAGGRAIEAALTRARGPGLLANYGARSGRGRARREPGLPFIFDTPLDSG